MVFSSSLFLLYFLPVFLLLYYIVKDEYKNFVILAGSVFFYAWGAPIFIFVLLGTTFVDFHFVKFMAASSTKLRKNLLLLCSLTINVGLLFYFKYANFFIDNINSLFVAVGIGEIPLLNVIMPIGISFYTFETVTYVVDVYRGVTKPLRNFWDYQTYIILFPKLIAGPIIRYNEIADQITDRKAYETAEHHLMGFYRFIIGLAKKVLIANVMGAKADEILSMDISTIDSTLAWTGILAYTMQIYFDFSGYSDMALGLGKMMGFRFPENFNNPYVSRSITEFWRRWHISLGAWMRNYLYIPLGGNRVKTRSRLYFNLALVFVISGFWHGAAWNFIIWGAYHGLFLILDRLFLERALIKIGKVPAILFTFLVTIVGWVLFRVEDFGSIWIYLKKMFTFNFSCFNYDDNSHFTIIFFVAVFFSFITATKFGEKWGNNFFFSKFNNKNHLIYTGVCLILLILCISFITSSGFNPFIYFRF